MKIYFFYTHNKNQIFQEFNISSGTTVHDFLSKDFVKSQISKLNYKYEVSVNGRLLDGKFNPKPDKYRLKEGQRIELVKFLEQDPKERRLKKI